MFEAVLFIFFIIAIAAWLKRSSPSAGALPAPELMGANVVEVLELEEFHGHSFMRLLIRRETGQRSPELEDIEAEGLMPRLWEPHVRSGTRLLVENVEPPLDRLILTDHVWNADEFASELASRFEEAEMETTEDSVMVAGVRNGVEASMEVDREGLLLFDIVTPLVSEDENLTVDFDAFDEELTPSAQIIAPGIAGSAWIVGAEDRPVPEEFARAVVTNAEDIRNWLQRFEGISIFHGRADTYTQLLVPEPRIALDLLDAFIELTRFETPESTETREVTGATDLDDDGGDWA